MSDNTELNIRCCKLSDSLVIQKLNASELGYDYPIAHTEEKLRELLECSSQRIFVAEMSGEIVGYVHACDYDLIYAPHMKNILGIAVSSEYRRRGIGKALLTAVEEWAHETGADGVRLTSGEERTDAHEFYKCCGYSCNKKQINFSKVI